MRVSLDGSFEEAHNMRKIDNYQTKKWQNSWTELKLHNYSELLVVFPVQLTDPLEFRILKEAFCWYFSEKMSVKFQASSNVGINTGLQEYWHWHGMAQFV